MQFSYGPAKLLLLSTIPETQAEIAGKITCSSPNFALLQKVKPFPFNTCERDRSSQLLKLQSAHKGRDVQIPLRLL